MITFHWQPDGCCTLRLSGEDAAFVCETYEDTPESRARLIAMVWAIFTAIKSVDKEAASSLVDTKVLHVYNLFRHYWDPSKKDSVLSQLKDCLLKHQIDVYNDGSGCRHVSVTMYGGQRKFVMLLLTNMNPEIWKVISQPGMMTALYRQLAGKLEYRHQPITAKSMRKTLIRAVRDVQQLLPPPQ